MSGINLRHVSYDEIVNDLKPGNDASGSSVLPEIARSGGDYASVTKSRVLVEDDRNKLAVISSPGGAPGDPHLHPDFNEWWVVFGGVMQYRVGEYETFLATFGDIVIAPCGYRHAPQAYEGDMCMRMVCSKPGSNHDLKGLEPARTIPLDDSWEPPNRIYTPFAYMKERHGLGDDWQETVLVDQRNRVDMFHVTPGNGAESINGTSASFWVILQGEVGFDFGGDVVNASSGSVVCAADGDECQISATGDDAAIFIEAVDPATL